MTARIELWNAHEYHADPALSHGKLDCFLDDPARYYGVHVAQPALWPEESSDALEFGSVFHEHFLFGRPLAELVCEIPANVLASNGHRKGKNWEEWRDEQLAAGCTPMLTCEMAKLRAMVTNLEQHPWARWLFEQPGPVECPITWEDERGIARRSLLDKFIRSRLIADLKSCQSVREDKFSRSCLDFGYHRQAAYYREAMFALTGEWLPFVFVCVEKNPPYSVGVFEMTGDFLALGEAENQEGLGRWAECWRRYEETGDPGVWVRPGSDEIQTLTLPGWAKRKFE
jgi:hypothetical protein